MAVFLEDGHFAQVVKYAPLISIDLVVKNRRGEVLLGRRTNEPAQGYWFVPGGRIYKNENIADAFRRIVSSETGHDFSVEEAVFLGVYEHFYSNSFVSPDISTHYVVLCYELTFDFSIELLPRAQHNDYKIVPIEALLQESSVHPNVKLYFKESK
jgi:colanic acid biosynthesis protein WcaH